MAKLIFDNYESANRLSKYNSEVIILLTKLVN